MDADPPIWFLCVWVWILSFVASRKLLETLEKWGWFVTKVGAGDGEPAFGYSMGLYENFHHPEIILFGLDLVAMHLLINNAGARIGTVTNMKKANSMLTFYKAIHVHFAA